MKTTQVNAEAYLNRPYCRVLIPDPETDTYAAMILEFPGCVTQGSTPDEAYERLEEAARAWIEAVVDLGQTIPEPHEENSYSGKFALRMPRGVHKAAAELAEREGTSLNQYIVGAVAEKVGANRLYAELSKMLEQKVEASTVSTVEALVKELSQVRIERTATTDR
jgi:predicted RNase H-like HicB family nuclease